MQPFGSPDRKKIAKKPLLAKEKNKTSLSPSMNGIGSYKCIFMAKLEDLGYKLMDALIFTFGAKITQLINNLKDVSYTACEA